MKQKYLQFLLLVSLTVLGGIISSCTVVQEKISEESDSTMAYKLPPLDISGFSFSEIRTLKSLLSDRINKYRVSIAYFKKVADLWKGNQGLEYDKKIALLEMDLNFYQAWSENLLLFYPEHWVKFKGEMQELDKKIQEIHNQLYKELI